MDRELISLKLTALRHTAAGMRPAGWVIGGLLVVGTWTAALVAGGDGARHSILTLALLFWGVGAAIGPVLMSGAGTLRPGWFALLPIPRRTLGRGLLVSVYVSIAAAIVLAALLAVGLHAALLDPLTLVVAIPGALLTWVLVIALSRLVYGLLGAAMGSRIGIEIASIQFGLMFAGMFAGWIPVTIAIERTPDLLATGITDGAVTRGLDLSPTSWSVLAVERAARGDWAGALLLLGALALCAGVVVAAAIPLLVPSTRPTVQRRRGRRRSAGLVAGGGFLPRTQTGAVIAKELRQWSRDGWRLVEVQSAVWGGILIGALALTSDDLRVVAAFTGLFVAFMLGIAACTMYGQDGSAVWLDVVGQDATSVRADVHGRQWGAVLTFLPKVLAVTAVFVVLSQAWWAVPILLAATPALFGAASGAAVLVAAVGVSPGVDPRQRVGPNDAVGNISLHVWVVMLLTSVAVAPTAGMIVALVTTPSAWLATLTVAVGLANGFGAAWLLGRITIGYLTERLPDLFSRIRYGQVFREPSTAGTLDWLESTTLKGEQEAKARRQKERADRIAKSSTR
jgi:ABC-2 type transport system permease protein